MRDISVIIAVYNAAPYLREAVASAVAQPQVGDVLLVDDGSSDGSLALCHELALEHAAVRVLQHPDGGNHGAGPTRNLGIRAAQHELIAFLDGDDTYLPGRFDRARALLAANRHADGVYESVKLVYENDIAREERRLNRPSEYAAGMLRPSHALRGVELANAALAGRPLYFSPNGLLVKRAALLTAGGFPSLAKGQDTALCFRLAFVAHMLPGDLDTPTSTYRLTGHNRTAVRPDDPHELYWRGRAIALDSWRWGVRHLPHEYHEQLLYGLLHRLSARAPFGPAREKLARLRTLLRLPVSYPPLLRQRFYYRKGLEELKLLPHRNPAHRPFVPGDVHAPNP